MKSKYVRIYVKMDAYINLKKISTWNHLFKALFCITWLYAALFLFKLAQY